MATIKDAGSKNGTYVNEERVTDSAEPRDRDLIRLGSARLTFRFITDEDPTADEGPPLN